MPNIYCFLTPDEQSLLLELLEGHLERVKDHTNKIRSWSEARIREWEQARNPPMPTKYTHGAFHALEKGYLWDELLGRFVAEDWYPVVLRNLNADADANQQRYFGNGKDLERCSRVLNLYAEGMPESRELKELAKALLQPDGKKFRVDRKADRKQHYKSTKVPRTLGSGISIEHKKRDGAISRKRIRSMDELWKHLRGKKPAMGLASKQRK